MQRRHLITACLALSSPLAALAQAAFPGRPLTIVVPATPGGAIDLSARLIGAKLSVALGQPVAIDNLGGASGMLGTDRVAKAAPDGHTLALVASSHAINPSMYKKLPFDTAQVLRAGGADPCGAAGAGGQQQRAGARRCPSWSPT